MVLFSSLSSHIFTPAEANPSKRVFLLGPSHHYYLSGCALSKCHKYETPLGSLQLDLSTITELQKTDLFETMSISNDEDEHSLEMHLPYIYKMLSLSVSTIIFF
jgi:AmmeMemoRadiSam system protein B